MVDPMGALAGFESSDPVGAFVAGFESGGWELRYRATVSRLMPSSLAIRRWDQPRSLSVHIVFTVAKDFDRQWQQRKRTINTMLLILFIFRLVFSKNKQGYGTTIIELWEQCRVMKIPLPQKKPVVPSAFSNARKKLDESIFKELNAHIIKTYELEDNEQRSSPIA